jgi:hypothetical protein
VKTRENTWKTPIMTTLEEVCGMMAQSVKKLLKKN